MRWIRYFTKAHEVHLISLQKPAGDGRMLTPDEYTKAGVKVHFVKATGAGRLLVPFEVRRLINEIKPDIVHSHYISHYGFLGAFSGFRPIVMTAWGTDVLIEPEKSMVKGFQVRYALKRADIVTCDGENTAAKLASLGVPGGKIMRIYFGVDTARASPARRDTGIYGRYKRDSLDKVVVDIRGFTPVYDPATYVKAAAKVLKHHPHTVFVMAREGEGRKETEDMVRSMGIQDNFAFIGNIPADLIPAYLASSDVYVSTSLSDSGIAASTAEAMSCGAAVVSTDVGDIRIWIRDGVNGFVVAKGDPESLAARIDELLSNDELRGSIGVEARKTMLERQDYNKEMGKVESLYVHLVEEEGR
ncbi:MAG: glycosyltransferase [Methanomassiliicoccales archaeon]|nr:glycosyltransferase [Methanomassiliicoccales archaeon]